MGLLTKKKSTFINILEGKSVLTEMKIWIFILMLAVLLASNIVLKQEVIPIVENSSSELAIQSGDAIAAEIHQKLTTAKTLAVSLASLASELPKDETLHFALLPKIINIKGLENFVAGGGVWPEPFKFDETKERRSFFWGRNEHNELEYYDDYNDPKGAGYHHEEWYVPAKYIAEDKVYWSKSYADPYSHQPMVTVTAPIFIEQDFYGVTTVDIKLEGIKAIIDERTAPLGGYGFIIDRNGKFISFPEQSLDIKVFENGEYTTLTAVAKQNDAFLPYAEMINQHHTDTIKNADKQLAKRIANESYQIELEEAKLISSMNSVSGDEHKNSNLISSRDMSYDAILEEPSQIMLFHIADTQWLMAIVVPESRYLSSVYKLGKRVTMYQLSGVILMMMVLFFVFNRLLSQPFTKIISQLQQATERKGLGLIDYSGSNEFGVLSEWFNKRTKQLQLTEIKLKESAENLQGALDSANAGTLNYIIKDEQLIWDDNSYRLFGMEPQSFGNVYDAWREKVHPDDIDQCERLFQSAVDDEKIADFSMEYRICLPHHKTRWIQVSIRIQRDSGGNAISCRGLHLDITARKDSESLSIAKESAEKSNRSKSEFLANMSHELRTPMHGILSFSKFGVKKSETASREKLHQYFTNIQTSGHRLLALLNDLLDLSKIEVGKMEMAPSDNDLVALFESCHLEQQQRVDDLDLTIHYEQSASPVVGHFDPVRIGQVITNLLSNAIKFSPRGGAINIVTKIDEQQLIFSIQDQGLGIPDDEIETIFDAFVQSSKTKTGAGGTGLGLAISKQIIEIHKGKIWAENSHDGGALFTFIIPACKIEGSER